MTSTSFFGYLATVADDLVRARNAAALYDDLSHLGDAGLKARGLNRADLPAYVMRRAFGEF